MKNLNSLWAVLMLAVMSVGLASCGSDDDDATLQFTKNVIVGNWQVKDFVVNSGETRHVSIGKVIEFYSNGTCKGFHSMEDSYRINSGRVETFCARNNEPMFVYTLLSNNNNTIKVRMDGTLDDDLSCILTLEKN